MADNKRKFWTVGQIDATGVRGPHEKELEDISKMKHPIFINVDMEKLRDIVEENIGGKIENIGFNEDWAISLEMFPPEIQYDKTNSIGAAVSLPPEIQ